MTFGTNGLIVSKLGTSENILRTDLGSRNQFLKAF